MGQEAGNVARNERGVIVGSKGLTEQQAAFVREWRLNGGDAVEAARTAQFANPVRRARELLRLPHIIAAIQQEQDTDYLALTDRAIAALREILNLPALDPATNTLKINASKAVFGRVDARIKQEREAAGDAANPLGNMSLKELEDYVAKREAELANVPKAVTLDRPSD